jgi:hypothetical protein
MAVNAFLLFLAPTETRAAACVLNRRVHRKNTQAAARVSVGAKKGLRWRPGFLRSYH